MNHHLYNQYVEEKGKDRIVWFDEGIAMNVSNDHDYLNDDTKFKEFLQKNILGATKYPLLNSHKNFLELSKHKDEILKAGEDALSKAIDYYCDKYKLNKN